MLIFVFHIRSHEYFHQNDHLSTQTWTLNYNGQGTETAYIYTTSHASIFYFLMGLNLTITFLLQNKNCIGICNLLYLESEVYKFNYNFLSFITSVDLYLYFNLSESSLTDYSNVNIKENMTPFAP